MCYYGVNGSLLCHFLMFSQSTGALLWVHVGSLAQLVDHLIGDQRVAGWWSHLSKTLYPLLSTGLTLEELS